MKYLGMRTFRIHNNKIRGPNEFTQDDFMNEKINGSFSLSNSIGLYYRL